MVVDTGTIRSPRKGAIEVICGSMFSGKTEELIRRLRRAEIARQEVYVAKPHIDIRFDAEKVVSHNANAIEAVPIIISEELLDLPNKINVLI